MRSIVIAVVGLATMSAHPALACSGRDLADRVKKLSELTIAAFVKDPSGDEARKERVMAIIERYRPMKHASNGPAIVEAACREYDELISVYQ